MTQPSTLSSDPLQILLLHDEWATRRILDICLALSDTDFDRDFGIGPGTLRATTTHIISRMRYWADNIAQRTAVDKPKRSSLAGKVSCPRLIEALTPAAADLRAVAHDAVRTGLDATITTTWSNAPILTKGTALVHVTTHSMHPPMPHHAPPPRPRRHPRRQRQHQRRRVAVRGSDQAAQAACDSAIASPCNIRRPMASVHLFAASSLGDARQSGSAEQIIATPYANQEPSWSPPHARIAALAPSS